MNGGGGVSLGLATHTGLGAISMKEDYVHTSRLCSRSSKPYAMVFGGVLLPWVKGLKGYL